MLQIGWIDYSKEHRDRVMSVLDMLRRPGAVDELGISVIRDAFSDRLFPGLSTLLTRAKYFLIVPWIMRDLEREGLDHRQFSNRLHQRETDLIPVLSASGEQQDVIGSRAGVSLKRKPSELYWNGLRTYGIFRDRHMSLGNYIAVAQRVSRFNQERKSSIHRDGDVHDDGDALGSETIGPFWDVLEPPADWKERMRFNLSQEQAVFLRDKIILSPYSKDSLLAYILAQCPGAASRCGSFRDLAAVDMPARVRHDYELARDFAQLIYGAHIRYNVAFFRSIHQVEKADAAQATWKAWVSEMERFDFERWDIDSMLKDLQVDRGVHAAQFVRQWDRYARRLPDVSEDELDVFVTKREMYLKGRERAKIGNWPQFRGDWLGIRRLEYRWPNARRIIRDIADGLEAVDA